MTTTENNKLIAEFMGLKQGKDINKPRWKDDWFENLSGRRHTHLHFDNDWDWLMPVIAKLVDDFGDGWKFEEGYDLDVRYQYVVKFIEEHNVQLEKDIKNGLYGEQ